MALYSLADFWKRWTPAEREALENMLALGTQVQRDKINAFRAYVRDVGGVDNADPYIVGIMTLAETAGILGAGRAAQILS